LLLCKDKFQVLPIVMTEKEAHSKTQNQSEQNDKSQNKANKYEEYRDTGNTISSSLDNGKNMNMTMEILEKIDNIEQKSETYIEIDGSYVGESDKEFVLFNPKQDLGTWGPRLHSYFASKSFKGLYDYLKTEYSSKKICPSNYEIFNAFCVTPMHKLKAVIMTAEPYCHSHLATGFALSIPRYINNTEWPNCLTKIFEKIQKEVDAEAEFESGDLRHWASQGILLLNTRLTVVEDQPNSHKYKGWSHFINAVLDIINSDFESIVFLLLGHEACNFGQGIDELKHCVITFNSPMHSYLFKQRKFWKRFDEAISQRHPNDPIDWSTPKQHFPIINQ